MFSTLFIPRQLLFPHPLFIPFSSSLGKRIQNTTMASSLFSFLITFLLLVPSSLTSATLTSFSKTPSKVANSPLSPKSSLLRYWNRKISNNNPQPSFFTDKLSPLSPLALTKYSSLSPSQLSQSLPTFCILSHIVCTPNSTLSPSLASHDTPSQFTSYSDSNFSNYADQGTALSNSFKAYSNDVNVAVDSFRRYSRNSVADSDLFSSYSLDGNVVTTNFTSYSSSQTGGSGTFSTYHTDTNVPQIKFTNYDTNANGPKRDFTSYTKDANHGDQDFSSYGKEGNGVPTTFTAYGEGANVMTSKFSGYGKNGNGENSKFTSYGDDGNVPENNFKAYGENGNGPVDEFKSYRDKSNVGDDAFSSYGKSANNEEASFINYGKSFNEGSDNFKGYGEDSQNDVFNFTSYSGQLTDFKSYENEEKGNEFSFKSYVNSSTVPHSDEMKIEEEKKMISGKSTNKWLVEPGKFFRESNLKKGNVMPMPDIRDRMPERSFLPRALASKIELSADNVRSIFKIPEDSAMGKAVGDTINDCQRAPSKGETKQCGTSAEDIIDFSVSVLGPNVVVRSTENTEGSKKDIMIGEVKGVNGGKITQSVSCHQSLFPYLVYYCHSVPKVRVYVADILDVESKKKINHGVAICHIDTSDWSAGHGAFLSLGSGPGKIEVCHWIFEGDMTWARAD